MEPWRQHTQWHRRAATHFARAVFYKPREEWGTALQADMAPLLVKEVREADILFRRRPRFGLVRPTRDGLICVDPALPTVYAASDSVLIHRAPCRQLVYLWCYPGACEGGDGDEQPQVDSAALVFSEPVHASGVRITLGTDGFPIVWEVLDKPSRPRLVFVSETLEGAAREAFGGPLPNRRFSIERSTAEAPRVVVVDVLEDGPVPMGPYVYIAAEKDERDRPHYAINSIACRCSPSQVLEMLESSYYDLLPLEELRGLRTTLGVVDRLAQLRGPDSEPPLASALRWPPPYAPATP